VGVCVKQILLILEGAVVYEESFMSLCQCLGMKSPEQSDLSMSREMRAVEMRMLSYAPTRCAH
jgi:hypothetical protein